MQRKPLTRRGFLGGSAALVAGATGVAMSMPRARAADATQPASANSRIILGVMGTGGRGTWLITEELLKRKNIEIACVCDVDESRVNNAANEVEKRTGRKPRAVSDFRHMLDDNNINAIFNITPDHWHALGTIRACQAGKDVYCEKPACHSMWEGRKMVEAARKYGRIVQLGTQTRSGPYTFEAIDFLRSGKLGGVHMVRVINMKELAVVPPADDAEPPKGVDYDMWVGPAPLKKFNPSRFHYNWHWRWDYSGGDIINDGIHQLDIARCLVGKDYPRSVFSTGGILATKDAKETPDTQIATWDFGDVLMHFELALWTPHMKKKSWIGREAGQFPNWQFNAMTV
jgi:predicted dehydrogenase